MNVLFFDIDGTLILCGGAGKEAMIQAALHQAGRGKRDDIEIMVSGRSDRGIAAELFEINDLPDTEDHWERFVELYVSKLRTNLLQREGTILPGVQRLLDELLKLEGTALGLLTGNLQVAAQIKLEHFGLNHYFDFGGYGDRCRQRDGIAREAELSARDRLDGCYDPARTWVIGDTPNDVRCARAIGANAVAVATGIYSFEELETVRPDYCLHDLSDTEEFLGRFGKS
ncbi:MAG: hypothetical protein CMJ81_02805 [Planctomycetaceae bacterium]|jgi:phosphoglycolate phosphatase-like HAD superfamily hydrolase|nr:hypothetical protein [Planctomycetaceae bacterium]MBP60783.1 hypothetical protein [Planctomycetaceae bacterium]